MRFFKSTRVRFFAAFFVLAIMPLVGLGLYSISALSEPLIYQHLTEESHEVERKTSRIRNLFKEVRDDLVFVSTVQTFLNLLEGRLTDDRSEIPYWKDLTEAVFLKFMQTKKRYMELTYIDEAGNEFLKVVSDGEMVSVAGGGELKSKATEAFFTGAMEMSLSKVYTSMLTLNTIDGTVQTPHNPIIRLSTPVYDSSGAKRGVVMLVMYAKPMLAEFKKISRGEIFLVNSDGYFLAHPNPENEWAFVLDNPDMLASSLAGHLPAYSAGILSGGYGRIVGSDGELISYAPVNFDQFNAGNFWVAVKSDTVEETLSPVRDFKETFFSILAILTITLLSFSYYTERSTKSSVLSIAKSLKGVAAGDLSHGITIKKKDDIGDMAVSLDEMIYSLRDMMSGIRDASERLAVVADGIRRSTEGIHESADANKLAIEQTSTSLVYFDSSVKDVAEDAQALLKSSEGASSSALEMSASVTEVAESADKLAQSVDETASSINEIAASLKEVSSHIHILFDETAQVASASLEINFAVKEVDKFAIEQAMISEKGLDIVSSRKAEIEKNEKVMDGMIEDVSNTSRLLRGLGERSHEIGSITNVISEIAETLNLLALNASILAAQAGEHGKSFAVVSTEVKTLAEKTAKSTKEISSLITDVQAHVQDAIETAESSITTLVDATRHSNTRAMAVLSQIKENSEKSLDMASRTEKATGEQTKAMAKTAQSIQRITSMVEEIKKATDEQASSSDNIVHAVESMQDITTRVKLSTKEQSQVGKHIWTIINDVTERMRAITEATAKQRSASERIVRAVDTFRNRTEDNVDLAKGLDKAVEDLDAESSSLMEKVGKFKV